MARGVRPSGARLVWTRRDLVQVLRQKSRWFVKNIVPARPNVRPLAGPRSIHRQALHPVDTQRTSEVQVTIDSQEMEFGEEAGELELAACSPSSAAGGRTLKSSRRLKRVVGRTGTTLSPVSEEYDSDAEDFGRPLPHIDEDSSLQSEYHTARSHLTEVSALGAALPTQPFDENADVVFSRVRLGSYELLPVSGSSTEECSGPQLGSAPASPMATDSSSSAAQRLAAPSLMLTLPMPQIAHSPVFVPRSPITLAKYVEATTPLHMLTSLPPQQPIPSCSSLFLSPAPSLPICERSCLSQLEYGIVCRSCEKQWLACKVWYQAHDGGRRQWLTEPYIKPAESTASVRAVMRVLGVPGDAANVRGRASTGSIRGLGIGSSFSFKQELPFGVLATSSDTSRPRARFGSCSSSGDASGGSSNYLTRLRMWTANAKRVVLIRRTETAQGRWTALRALWSASAGLLFPRFMPRDSRFTGRSPSMSDDSSATSGGLHIDGHQWPPSVSAEASLSSGSSSSADAMACITSGSRYVEHLWWPS